MEILNSLEVDGFKSSFHGIALLLSSLFGFEHVYVTIQTLSKDQTREAN